MICSAALVGWMWQTESSVVATVVNASFTVKVACERICRARMPMVKPALRLYEMGPLTTGQQVLPATPGET